MKHRFIWTHRCHGLIGEFDHLDLLVDSIDKSPYPRPDKTKMVAELNTKNHFSYALNLLNIEKVTVTTQ